MEDFDVQAIDEHLTWLEETYEHYLRFSDKRVESWPLMDSPAGTILLVFCYSLVLALGLIVTRCGKPFKLSFLLLLNDLGMLIWNGFLVYQLVFPHVDDLMASKYQRVLFPPLDTSDAGLPLAKLMWLTYLTQIIDFSIGFFKVLTGHSVSFAHYVYHAATFPILWVTVKWYPGGIAWILALNIALFNVVLYSYLTFASIGLRPFWSPNLFGLLQLALSAGYVGYAINSQIAFPVQVLQGGLIYISTLLVLQLISSMFASSRKATRPVVSKSKKND